MRVIVLPNSRGTEKIRGNQNLPQIHGKPGQVNADQKKIADIAVIARHRRDRKTKT